VKAAKGQKAIPKRSDFDSKEAALTVAKANPIEPMSMKRGQKAKFLEYGRVDENGVLSVYERDVVITSVNPSKRRITFKPAEANAGGQRPTSTVGVDKNGKLDAGTFHSAESQPKLAFQISRARTAEQELKQINEDVDKASLTLKNQISGGSGVSTSEDRQRYLNASNNANYARESQRRAQREIELGRLALAEVKANRTDSYTQGYLDVMSWRFDRKGEGHD
jgi:hypothetical protein